MKLESKLSWNSLKNIVDALDSYRVRVLIDAKEEIIDAGIYNENQYYEILFKIIDDEKLKYALFEFIKKKKEAHLEELWEFCELNSLNLLKTLSFLELLKNEKSIIVDELHDTIEATKNNPSKSLFRDYNIRINHADISTIKPIYEPVGVIFNSKVCSGCGTCAGVCPVNCLNVLNGFGEIDKDKCIRCGLCYFVCPRSYFPIRLVNMYQDNASKIKDYSEIGHFIEVYSARTKIKEISKVCQDGGISSTCLYYLFDSKEIEYALGAKMSNTLWRPDPLLLKSKEDIIQTAGTKYVNNPTLRILNEFNSSNHNVAVVGVPCMMQALLKSEIYNIGIPSLNNVKYKIGIFCMESFSYQSLLKICEVLKVEINDIRKMDINKGKFFVYSNNGEEYSVPIKEISHLAREDCEVCYDLTSESADISVGSIGSPSGWNTVIIRNEIGKKLYESLIEKDLIESKPIANVKPGLSLLKKVAISKKSNCTKHINKKREEKVRVPIY